MGRTTSAQVMKVFLDTYCKMLRCEEELCVLRREVAHSVEFCEKQLVLIDMRLASLGDADPHTREGGQHIQLSRRRSRVSSLRERLLEIRDKIVTGQSQGASETVCAQGQPREGKTDVSGDEDEGAEVEDPVWEEEYADQGEEFDSALGGSLMVESDEDL